MHDKGRYRFTNQRREDVGVAIEADGVASANSRPRPSTRMRPSTFTIAPRAEITQIWPAGCTRGQCCGSQPRGGFQPSADGDGQDPNSAFEFHKVAGIVLMCWLLRFRDEGQQKRRDEER